MAPGGRAHGKRKMPARVTASVEAGRVQRIVHLTASAFRSLSGDGLGGCERGEPVPCGAMRLSPVRDLPQYGHCRIRRGRPAKSSQVAP
jgi:hypothetical protein